MAMVLLYALADGTATPDQLTDRSRLSLVVLVGLVLGLVGVAVQVLPPQNRLLRHLVGDACYLGGAELLIWYFVPDHVFLLGLLIGVPAIVFFIAVYTKFHRYIPDYLPSLSITVTPPRRRLRPKSERDEHPAVEPEAPSTEAPSTEAPSTEAAAPPKSPERIGRELAVLVDHADQVKAMQREREAIAERKAKQSRLETLIQRGEALIAELDRLQKVDRLRARYRPDLTLSLVAQLGMRYVMGGGAKNTNQWLYDVATYIASEHPKYSDKIFPSGISKGPMSAEKEAIEHNLTILREIQKATKRRGPRT
jgi:hypothetical protein